MAAHLHLRNVHLIGSGHYLPERVMSNDDLAKKVDTSDAWILQRTGIRQRHLAAADQRTSDLAKIAAQNALDMAGIPAQTVDLIILATTTPDNTFPATATRIAHQLGTQCTAYDVQAVCAGFVFALEQADMALKLGKAKRALVIGAEVYSRILNWQDRETCVLFGDGAGAIVLESREHDPSLGNHQGVIDTELASDGQHYFDLFVDGGTHDHQAGVVKMAGREVYKKAIVYMSDVINILLDRNGLCADDIQWLIPHQANIRIMKQVAEKLGVGMNKVVSTVDRHANISAATIPTALDIAVRDGRIQANDLLALTALGGGFSWGGALLRSTIHLKKPLFDC